MSVFLFGFLLIMFLCQSMSAVAQEPVQIAVGGHPGGTAQEVAMALDERFAQIDGKPSLVAFYPAGFPRPIGENIDVIVSADLSAANLEALALSFTFTSREHLFRVAAVEMDASGVNGVDLVAYIPTYPHVMISGHEINDLEDIRGRTFIDSGRLSESVHRLLENIGSSTERRVLDPKVGSASIETGNVASLPVSLLRLSPGKWRNMVLSITNHRYGGVWVGVRAANAGGPDDHRRIAIKTAIEDVVTTKSADFASRSEAYIQGSGATVHNPENLAQIFASLGPDLTNTNGCTNDEYRKKVDNACKCVTGDKDDEC